MIHCKINFIRFFILFFEFFFKERVGEGEGEGEVGKIFNIFGKYYKLVLEL
jgi:hypothetical protein